MQKDALFPIYGIWHKPFWQTRTFFIIVWILITVLVLLLFWVLIKKFLLKRREKPSWVKALDELEKLKKMLITGKIDPKWYYITLTSILKQYFFSRYGYDVLGKTDAEVLAFLEGKHFREDLLEGMEKMFGGLLVVKFANAKAAKEQMEADLARCIHIVKETVPSEKTKK